MAPKIKHPDATQPGRDPSALTALRKRLERQSHGQVLADELNRIADRCSKLPILDERSEDEILGYDAMPASREETGKLAVKQQTSGHPAAPVFGAMGRGRNTDDVMKELRGHDSAN